MCPDRTDTFLCREVGLHSAEDGASLFALLEDLWVLNVTSGQRVRDLAEQHRVHGRGRLFTVDRGVDDGLAQGFPACQIFSIGKLLRGLRFISIVSAHFETAVRLCGLNADRAPRKGHHPCRETCDRVG